MEQRLLGGKFSKDGAGAPNVNRGGVTRRTQEDLWSSVPQGHHLEHTEFSQSAPGGPAESVGTEVMSNPLETPGSHTLQSNNEAAPGELGVLTSWV